MSSHWLLVNYKWRPEDKISAPLKSITTPPSNESKVHLSGSSGSCSRSPLHSCRCREVTAIIMPGTSLSRPPKSFSKSLGWPLLAPLNDRTEIRSSRGVEGVGFSCGFVRSCPGGHLVDGCPIIAPKWSDGTRRPSGKFLGSRCPRWRSVDGSGY